MSVEVVEVLDVLPVLVACVRTEERVHDVPRVLFHFLDYRGGGLLVLACEDYYFVVLG